MAAGGVFLVKSNDMSAARSRSWFQVGSSALDFRNCSESLMLAVFGDHDNDFDRRLCATSPVQVGVAYYKPGTRLAFCLFVGFGIFTTGLYLH